MSNLTDIVTTAVQAAGAGDSDWRVQAGAAALLILAGCAALGRRRLLKKTKRLAQRRRGAEDKQ